MTITTDSAFMCVNDAPQRKLKLQSQWEEDVLIYSFLFETVPAEEKVEKQDGENKRERRRERKRELFRCIVISESRVSQQKRRERMRKTKTRL